MFQNVSTVIFFPTQFRWPGKHICNGEWERNSLYYFLTHDSPTHALAHLLNLPLINISGHWCNWKDVVTKNTQPTYDVRTTLHGRWNDVKTLKWRWNNVVLTSYGTRYLGWDGGNATRISFRIYLRSTEPRFYTFGEYVFIARIHRF